MEPPSVQSPFAHLRCYRELHYSSVIAHTAHASVPAWTFSTLFCASFLVCLVPCHGGPIACMSLLTFAMSSAFPLGRTGWLPASFHERDFSGVSFRDCRHFFLFQAPKFARLPDRSDRNGYAIGRPRLLHPGRMCLVASARTGYASCPLRTEGR